MKDIVCIDQGLFTAFIPQTTAGEAVFNAMSEDTQGKGAVTCCRYMLRLSFSRSKHRVTQ